MTINFTPFTSKNFQIRDHFFALLLHYFLDIGPWEVEAKRRLNGTSKMNTWTDKQTDKRTFRLIESIGPEGQCFENCFYGSKGTNKNTQKKFVLYNKVVVADCDLQKPPYKCPTFWGGQCEYIARKLN